VIISSNFTISQIEDFYSERIFSRIISSYTILRLFGTDIRYLKRTKMLKN
jgi:DNA replication protein DnaC